MIENFLMYSYIFGGFAVFWYWISALLAFFRTLKHRREDRSLITVLATGLFNENNFTEEGKTQRKLLFRSFFRFFAVLSAMVLIVLIGIQTQG